MLKPLRKLISDELYWTLIGMRWIAIAGQLTAILIVRYGIDLTIPMRPLLAILVIHACWNLVSSKLIPPQPRQYRRRAALELGIDMVALTALFYLTGGPANPFVFLYLVPIALTAVAWDWKAAVAFGVTCVAAYTLLHFYNTPLPSTGNRFGGDFQLHMIGMWVNFILSALLIALAVGLLAASSRHSQAVLQQLRESKLRDQQIISLGALAAGAAHELNTPLSTMSLLIGELQTTKLNDEQVEDLALLNKQVDSCRRSVERLLSASGSTSLQSDNSLRSASSLFGEIAQHWSVTRPEIQLKTDFSELPSGTRVLEEPKLRQALVNILDNAADASLQQRNHQIRLSIARQDEELLISVRDFGGGPPDISHEGRIQSTKPGGHGLGLALTSASLELIGATLTLRPADLGTEAEIRISLSTLSHPNSHNA